jgi:hypothetical protein
VPKTVLRPLVVIASFVCFVTSAAAQDVTVRWIPPASAGVAGYNVYIAPATSGSLVATPIDVGRPTVDATGVASARITGVDRSRTLAIEMTSYDAARVQSARSNRVTLAALGETLGDPLVTADFTGRTPGTHALGFFDWGGTFLLARLSDGNIVDAAPTTWVSAVSRYLAGGSTGWGSYEISGRIYLGTSGARAGVAARVGASDLSSGFLLGSDSRGVFSLEQRGKSPLSCASSASTGVSAVAGLWFKFKLRYTNPSSRSRLRAKVWRATDAEPAAWQADCWTDVPPASDTGIFALYRDNGGTVFWDDLDVRPVTGTLAPIP